MLSLISLKCNNYFAEERLQNSKLVIDCFTHCTQSFHFRKCFFNCVTFIFGSFWPLESILINLHCSSCVSEDCLLCGPELHLHAVRFRRQSDPIDWGVVRLSCILRPDELELPQQSHHDEEELHTGQTLSKAHTRT